MRFHGSAQDYLGEWWRIQPFETFGWSANYLKSDRLIFAVKRKDPASDCSRPTTGDLATERCGRRMARRRLADRSEGQCHPLVVVARWTPTDRYCSGLRKHMQGVGNADALRCGEPDIRRIRHKELHGGDIMQIGRA